MTFMHKFVVKRHSSGILGMDCLQQVAAETSLTTRLLIIDRYSFPLTDWESGVSKDQRLANEGQERLRFRSQEQASDGSVEEWLGTVDLAGTVTVPRLSVRIARYRVVRRDSSAVIKVPRNQVVMVDPECLPGIYIARLVAVLEVCEKMSSSNTRGSDPLVGKSPLVVSPQVKCVAGSDGRVKTAGSGENLPEMAEGGQLSSATDTGCDLQEMCSSLSIENRFGTQVDTNQNYQSSTEWQNATREKKQISKVVRQKSKRK
jgi:hypothetical protein